MPIGIVHTKLINSAMHKLHHVMFVGQAQAVAKLIPNITTSKIPYHHHGTAGYLRIIFVWLSSSVPRTARACVQISRPWKRRVWKITAAMAAKARP